MSTCPDCGSAWSGTLSCPECARRAQGNAGERESPPAPKNVDTRVAAAIFGSETDEPEFLAHEPRPPV
jgi:uncharacterized Zn finger protein (UPF0148 family)